MAFPANATQSSALAVVLVLVLAGTATVLAQEEPTPVPEETPAAAAPEPAPTPVAAPEPEQAKVPMVYREKTLITVNGRAEMDGVVELGVKPNNGEPVKVRVNILKKTKTKKIAKALVEQLVFTLGDGYKVKQTSDQTIRVEAKKKNPPVAIWLLTQNLSGVSVMIGHG